MKESIPEYKMLHKCAFCEYTTKMKANLQRHQIRKHSSELISTMQLPILAQNAVMPAQNTVMPAQNTVMPAQNTVIPAQNVDMPAQNVDIALEKEYNGYNCTRCSKSFQRLFNFNRHISICKGISNPLECHICHKIFADSSSKAKHIKNFHFCAVNFFPDAPEVESAKVSVLSTSPNDTVETQNTNNFKIQTQNNAENIHNTVNNTTNNNTNNTNNIQNNTIINLQLRSFGDESTDHISKEFVIKCIESGEHGILNMLEKLYFDKDCPENHNTQILSLKNRLVKVFQSPNWEVFGLDETSNTMITNASLCIRNIGQPYIQEQLEKDDEFIALNYQNVCNPSSKIITRGHEKIKARLVQRRNKKHTQNPTLYVENK